jgi:hypothetical protein
MQQLFEKVHTQTSSFYFPNKPIKMLDSTEYMNISIFLDDIFVQNLKGEHDEERSVPILKVNTCSLV